MQYQSILILGRQPALGLAELESLYGAEHVTAVAEHAAALDLPPDQIDFKRLGGSTRLCRLLTELPSTDWNAIERYLAKTIPQHLQYLPEGKLKLGLSTIGLKVTPARLTAAGLTLKKVIRTAGRSVRLVPNQTTELNTAQVQHNSLTGPLGWELLAIATTKGTTLLAQTIAVQDIDSYTLRDRGRPKRDARVGMLPPKLAQIIINLANPTPAGVVLDPFCGTGVLLQEALLMGYGAYGTDLEPRMISYTNTNLEWLQTKFDLPNPHIFTETQDATTFQNHDTIDAVAAETYLGRPFTTQPTSEVLAQTASEVNLIIRKTLQNLARQLPAGTRLCLAVPAWQIAPASGNRPAKFKHLPLIDGLDQLGYNRTRFEHVRDDQLVYYREDQIVARELLVLTRK